MNTYLLSGNYLGANGNGGLLSEGGTSRKKTIEKLAVSQGGKVTAVYYAFGNTDIYAIVEMPDDASMAAISLAARASGMVNVVTKPLLSPAVMDEAAKKLPSYRGPGR